MLVRQMIDRLAGLLTILAGITLLGCGLLYDIVFAGIPPQDSPPRVLQHYLEQVALAAAMQRSGLILLGAGLLLLALQSIIRLHSRKVA